MDNSKNPPDSGSKPAGNDAKSCRPASKWAALVDDQHIPAPKRRVKVSVLKTQASVPKDHTLFRDVSPAGDVPLKDDDTIDLAEGNTFYSREGCFEPPATPCTSRPKLAWFVDDHHEITLVPRQTGKSLRELFSLEDNQCLLRDLDSPNDDPIKPDETVEFADGPVLITRCDQTEFTIKVNSRDRTVSKSTLTYDDLVRLAFPNPPSGPNLGFTITYRRGPACNPQGTLVQGGDPVKIQNGMCFNVTPTDRS